MAPTSKPEGGEEKGASINTLDAKTMDKIVAALQELDDSSSKVHQIFEESRQKWEEIVQPQVEAISDSERLTEEDFAIRINRRD